MHFFIKSFPPGFISEEYQWNISVFNLWWNKFIVRIYFCVCVNSPVPDSIVLDILKDRLCQLDCVTRGWVLHGYPRTREQAEQLDKAGLRPNRSVSATEWKKNEKISCKVNFRYLATSLDLHLVLIRIEYVWINCSIQLYSNFFKLIIFHPWGKKKIFFFISQHFHLGQTLHLELICKVAHKAFDICVYCIPYFTKR